MDFVFLSYTFGERGIESGQ